MSTLRRVRATTDGALEAWRSLLLGLLLCFPARAQITRWTAPTNSTLPAGWSFGDGSRSTNPVPFFLPTIRGWLRQTNTPHEDLTLYFHPGDYQVTDTSDPANWEHKLRIYGDTNRVVRLIGIPNATNGALPRLIMTAEPAASQSLRHHSLTWPPRGGVGDVSQTFIQTVADSAPNGRGIFRDGLGYRDYPKGVEIENLELDGNFDGQGALSSAANPSGYRSFAIDVWARTGRIRNVKVRHFGSVGQTPASQLEGNSEAGTEAFPVRFVTFDDEKPTNTVPWLVEDVEVSDFHWLHGGYGTMVLGSVYTTNAFTHLRPPVAILRRCVVNDGSIAFGAASHSIHVWNGGALTNPASFTSVSTYSSLARHEDNVVLNTGAVFNTDTGLLASLVMTNSIYLDVRQWGNFGKSQSDPLFAAPGYIHWHRNYQLVNSLFRLRGRFTAPAYTDYAHQTNVNGEAVSDPNLPLGRAVDDWANGLVIQGESSNTFFNQNFISTWPAAGFYLADPASTNNSTFRVIWKVASQTYFNGYPAVFRAPSQQVTLSDNRLSATAFDFTGNNLLSNGTGGSTIASFTSSSAPAYTASRLALTALPVGFNPAGRVERVSRVWTASTNLGGVREIAVGQTYLTNSGQLAVTLRAVEHRTTAAAGGTAGTVPLVSSNLRLSGEIIAPGGATNALGVVSGTTDTNGLRVLVLNLGTNVNGLCRLRAWLPEGNTNFVPTTQAWASLDHPLGNVVSLTASPDVADDKNTVPAKRAQLRFARTGTPAALAVPLTVSFRLPTNGVPELTSPVDLRNLIASYGTGTSGDYTLGSPTGGTLDTITPGGISSVTFSASSTQVVVPIVPRPDNFTEANVIRVDLISTATNIYALGAQKQADIYIYDGPLWTVQTLEAVVGPGTVPFATHAVNAGVVGASGGWTVPPQAVGLATWNNPTPEQHGVVWTSQGSTPVTDLGLVFQPYGISFRPSTLAADRARIVGTFGNAAYQVLDNNSGGVTLPHFSGWTGPSAAWGISPNGTWTVGYSTSFGKRRAARWTGTGTPIDLSSVEDPMNERIGEAMAVNNAGVIVGYSSGFLSSTNLSLKRPFRNTGNGAAFGDSDWLAVPAGTGNSGEGTGNAVTTFASAHYAVGWFRRNQSLKRAVLWTPASGQSLPSVANNLATLDRIGSGNDEESEATGINSARTIVGWSGLSETSSDRRAIFRQWGRDWIDLNDPHFIHGSTGWILQSAEAISDNDIIVGTGTVSGAPRGFMLIPRFPGN